MSDTNDANLIRAKRLVSRWPKWKRDVKLTKYDAEESISEEMERFEKELTKELNDIGLFPVPRTIKKVVDFAFKWGKR